MRAVQLIGGLSICALALASAGCGGAASSTATGATTAASSAVTDAPSTTSATTATTTPAPAPNFSGATTVTDTEGYSYSVTYSLSLGSFSSSIANASPGYEDGSLPVTATVTETNTTSGRNAPRQEGLFLGALYDGSSPACLLNGGLGVDGACYLEFAGGGTGIDGGPEQLGPNQSTDVVSVDGSLTNSLKGVKQTVSDSVMATALLHPKAWVLAGTFQARSEPACNVQTRADLNDSDKDVLQSSTPLSC